MKNILKFTKIQPFFLFPYSFYPDIYLLGQSLIHNWHSYIYKLSFHLIWNLPFVFAWFVFKFFISSSRGLTFKRHRAGNDEAWLQHLSPKCCYRVIWSIPQSFKRKRKEYRIKVPINIYVAVCKAISHLLNTLMLKQSWAVRKQELSLSSFYR